MSAFLRWANLKFWGDLHTPFLLVFVLMQGVMPSFGLFQVRECLTRYGHQTGVTYSRIGSKRSVDDTQDTVCLVCNGMKLGAP